MFPVREKKKERKNNIKIYPCAFRRLCSRKHRRNPFFSHGGAYVNYRTLILSAHEIKSADILRARFLEDIFRVFHKQFRDWVSFSCAIGWSKKVGHEIILEKGVY